MICRVCKNDLPLDKFSFRSKKENKRNTCCKECQKLYCRDHYRENKTKHNKRRQKNKIKERIRNQEYVEEYLKTHPCVDCGISKPYLLEFDHINKDKYKEVSILVCHGYPIKRLKEEITKCEVRCGNCHRIRHYEENGWE